MALQVSTKHGAIDKANAQMVAVVAVAAFVAVFCLVAAHSVWGQTRYQAKVVSMKEKANQQLKKNVTAFASLDGSYKEFDGQPVNVINGNSKGSGDNDGPNSKIILDALPPVYDFPAMTASIEKVINDQGLNVSSITGTDDQLNQQNNLSSPTPQPVQIPFSFTVSNANYDSIGKLVSRLQQSIRPIQIDTLVLSGGANNMTLSVTGHTFYQPAKNVNVTQKVVK